jgi:hypothetical protein
MGQGVNFNAAGQGGGGIQLNAFQNATLGAVNNALQNGNLTDAQKQQLQTDMQAVQQAEASGDPRALHEAMHKLRQDAKADGVQGLPKGKGKSGADNQLGPDDLLVKGDNLRVAGMDGGSTAGANFGYNGANSMFGDGFSRT